MSALVTRRNDTSVRAALGIPISSLERRALDDPILRAGCALAEPYVCCDPCWRRWVCARVIEHLRGDRYWDELGLGDFGVLERRCHTDAGLLEAISERVAMGADTVAVLDWALATGQPFGAVAAILRTVEPSVRRVARFPWLSPTGACGRA